MKKHISTFAWFLFGLTVWFGSRGGMFVSAQQKTGPASDGRITAALLEEIGFSVPDFLQKNLDSAALKRNRTAAVRTGMETERNVQDPNLLPAASVEASMSASSGKRAPHRADIIPSAIPGGKNGILLTSAEELLETAIPEGSEENAHSQEPKALELADLIPLEAVEGQDGQDGGNGQDGLEVGKTEESAKRSANAPSEERMPAAQDPAETNGLLEEGSEAQTETVSEALSEDPFMDAPNTSADAAAPQTESLAGLEAALEDGPSQNKEIPSRPVDSEAVPLEGTSLGSAPLETAPLETAPQEAASLESAAVQETEALQETAPPAETEQKAEENAQLVPLESLDSLEDPRPAPIMPQPLEKSAGQNTFTEVVPETLETPGMDLKAAEPQSADGPAVIQGNGKPGETALEGIQVARLTVEKTAPAEIQVGAPSVWTITVRNEGKTAASGVQIHDMVPEGTQLVNTQPSAIVSKDGEITWNVGTMPSGTMAVVKMELMPTREGEIGSIASVSTRSEASAKAVATRPVLKVETFGEEKVLLGEPVELSIVVSNPGTGTARNVILSETVPPELQFEGGAELLYPVGDLLPGESKTTKLPLTAVRPGKFVNRILAKSESNLQTESVLEMEVTAPAISLKLQGPGRRFLEKESTFRLTLSNTGTASAKNAEFYVTVPNGWKFVRANNLGTFLPDYGRAVWKLEELEAGKSAEAEIVLAPMEIGSFTLQCEANADICQPSADSKNVTVEGIAALMFQVVDSNDPIQVGEDTQYTVEVVNQGSRQAENVQVAVDIPAGLELIACEERARTANVQGGKQLLFEQIPTLGPKASKVYRFTLRGVMSGDQRVSVKLSSKEFQDPIVKEESTRVFAE